MKFKVQFKADKNTLKSRQCKYKVNNANTISVFLQK